MFVERNGRCSWCVPGACGSVTAALIIFINQQRVFGAKVHYVVLGRVRTGLTPRLHLTHHFHEELSAAEVHAIVIKIREVKRAFVAVPL